MFFKSFYYLSSELCCIWAVSLHEVKKALMYDLSERFIWWSVTFYLFSEGLRFHQLLHPTLFNFPFYFLLNTFCRSLYWWSALTMCSLCTTNECPLAVSMLRLGENPKDRLHWTLCSWLGNVGGKQTELMFRSVVHIPIASESNLNECIF